MTTATIGRPTLRADWARITPLPPVFPFAWAVAHGRDRHGLWQAFEVAGVRQRLRWLPPGEFEMGSPPHEPLRADKETQHHVVLRQGFWLADTAVSQQLWLAVLGGKNPSRFGGDQRCPVENVSWNDIQQRFLPMLNQQLPGLLARLPGEAEWEYACREAGSAPGPFSFGEQLSTNQANYDGGYPMPGGAKGVDRHRTVNVDEMPRNAYGLSSMHGNVWEWVQDRYAPYPETEVVILDGGVTAPEGPSRTGRRVLRGGGWFNDARRSRSAQRLASDPSNAIASIGFRLARGPLPEAGWAEPTGGAAAVLGEPQADRRVGDGAPTPPAALPRGRRG